MNLIKKNAKGYNYSYTDLAEVNKFLAENGIEYYQTVERIEGDDYIFTTPIVDGKELPKRQGCRVVQATLKGVSNPAQEQGSAITYARRYSLIMAFGLATTDDDAASLSRFTDNSTGEVKIIEEMQVNKTSVTALKKACESKNIPLKEVLDSVQCDNPEDLTMGEWNSLMARLSKSPKRE